MQLPTILALLVLLEPGFELGKRDFRHGFHHILIALPDRKWLGFYFPGTHTLGRWRALPFGLS